MYGYSAHANVSGTVVLKDELLLCWHSLILRLSDFDGDQLTVIYDFDCPTVVVYGLNGSVKFHSGLAMQ